MTTVQTRTREIGDKEGFDIVVMRNEQRVDPTENGVMGKYDFDRKLKGTSTVADWKRERFERSYPGLTCDVLNGNGSAATGQTRLDTVRATYEEG